MPQQQWPVRGGVASSFATQLLCVLTYEEQPGILHGDARNLIRQHSVLALQGRCNADSNARTVTVMITDSCPECGADHMDTQVRCKQHACTAAALIEIAFFKLAAALLVSCKD